MPEASTGLKSFTVLPLHISEPSTACFIWAFEPSYTGTFWANHLVGPSCSCSCSRLVVPNRSPICGDGARSSFTELHFVPPRHFTPVLESKKYCADLEQLFTTFVNILVVTTHSQTHFLFTLLSINWWDLKGVTLQTFLSTSCLKHFGWE